MQSVTAGKQSETSLSQGWALRQTEKAAPFNANQRSYLDEKFLIGQSTGIKADHHRLHATFETQELGVENKDLALMNF